MRFEGKSGRPKVTLTMSETMALNILNIPKLIWTCIQVGRRHCPCISVPNEKSGCIERYFKAKIPIFALSASAVDWLSYVLFALLCTGNGTLTMPTLPPTSPCAWEHKSLCALSSVCWVQRLVRGLDCSRRSCLLSCSMCPFSWYLAAGIGLD